MNKRSVSPMGFIALIVALAVLLYLKHESNEKKINRQLIKETAEKPIGQIQRELNPEFVRMVEGDGNESH